MKLFAALRKITEFERLQLLFIRSLIDFDIIIEIGYAYEQERPLTPKQLFLLNVGSVTTVRRRLAKLTEQGIVKRRTNTNDRRSDILSISPASLKLLGRYGAVLGCLSAPS
jgi:DNA-binding MarR family transcriptional regulator